MRVASGCFKRERAQGQPKFCGVMVLHAFHDVRAVCRNIFHAVMLLQATSPVSTGIE